MDICEDIRHTRGTKSIYDLRKETIERVFGVAKENHSMRYTQQIGKEKNGHENRPNFCVSKYEKLAKILTKKSKKHCDFLTIFSFFRLSFSF